ncbi:MAG TPA: alpha/beta fold hydrolase, partial [Chloroflexota bacterium]|nr:alpha/beta fold hydrolase [Chloroflexota bacterium]
MPLVDLPLPQLQEYRPSPTREPDFDAFWEGTLAEASRIPLEIEVEPVADYPVPGLRLARVRYSGWAGSRICAWWLVPPEAAPGARDGRRPAMVFYHGYGGSKGGADLYLGWALQGYCVLAVDTRGQSGESSDPKPYPGGHATGYMTQGVLSPADYYYRGAYVDCLRALDVLGAQPEVDPSRIGLTGGSQGGALTLAVAALDPQRL